MKKQNLLMVLMMAFMLLETSLFGETGDATTILKDTASEQISGDIGWLFIIGGMVVAAITMMFQKNLLVPGIILAGSIMMAMSPDLADGVIQQFG